MSTDISSNRSTLKEFLASIATISGDLSNITAPPFVLAENSTVEIPQYWADHPALFVAPAAEPDPEKRALLVLKNFLSSLKNQQYAGRDESEGIKKPLNAFLGELFLGSWKDAELGETRLVSEQVSHHPPVTACYLWNEQQGIRAQGFTQQEITFSGSVSIKQKGYALLHVDKYDEDYLIPVPNVKVKGVVTGSPYPELTGDYSLISSSGFVSHIKFGGKGLLGTGTKNGFDARMYHVDNPKEDLYTAEGVWNGAATIVNVKDGSKEELDFATLESKKIEIAELSQQDPWESHRAWGDTRAALSRGDMKAVVDSKSVVEDGQREMRKEQEARGETWTPVFYKQVPNDPIFEKLVKYDEDGSFTIGEEGGIWKIDEEAIKNARQPYHKGLTPANQEPTEEAAPNDEQQTQQKEAVDQSGASVPNGHVNGASRVPSIQANGTDTSTTENSAPTKEISDLSTTDRNPDTSANGVKEPTDAEVEEFLRNRHSQSA